MNKTLPMFLILLVCAAAMAGCAGNEAVRNVSPIETKQEIQTADPEEFIRNYFLSAVKERNYEHLWMLSTENFNEANYGNEYQIFVDFWNSVESLEVESVKVTDRTDASAFCDVKMRLKIGGEEISTETQYHLIYNDSMRSWMFESP